MTTLEHSEMSQRPTMPTMCPLCMQGYLNPRILPCEHTFCTECLLGYMLNNVKNGRFGCPVCGDVCIAPAKIGINRIFDRMFPINEECSYIPKEPIKEKPMLQRPTSQDVSRKPSSLNNTKPDEAIFNRPVSQDVHIHVTEDTEPAILSSIKLQCNRPVCGITSYNNMIVVTHDADQHLWGYREGGEFVKAVEIPDLKCATGYSAVVGAGDDDKSAKLCVIDCDGRSMHLLTISGNLEILEQQMIDLGYRPGTLTGSRDLSRDLKITEPAPELIISEYGSHVVRCYNLQGDKIHQFTSPPGCVSGCAVKTPDGVYVTRDYITGSVVWCDASGRKLREYTDAQHPVTEPMCLTQDHMGNVLITYNNGILMINNHGEFVKDVVTDGKIWYPRCAHVSQDGVLYAAHYPLGDDKSLLVMPLS